jgi:hypothetical protein
VGDRSDLWVGILDHLAARILPQSGSEVIDLEEEAEGGKEWFSPVWEGTTSATNAPKV